MHESTYFSFPFFCIVGWIWNLVLALPLTACVTLGQALNPSEPLFYFLNNKTPLSNLNFFSLSFYSTIIFISFLGLVKSCNYFCSFIIYFLKLCLIGLAQDLSIL